VLKRIVACTKIVVNIGEPNDVLDLQVNRYYYSYREESVSRTLDYSQPFKIYGTARAFGDKIART
jgi:hypothetical protein